MFATQESFTLAQLHPIAQVASIVCGTIIVVAFLYFIHKIND